MQTKKVEIKGNRYRVKSEQNDVIIQILIGYPFSIYKCKQLIYFQIIFAIHEFILNEKAKKFNTYYVPNIWIKEGEQLLIGGDWNQNVYNNHNN